MEKQATFKKTMFGFDQQSVLTYIDNLYNESSQEIASLKNTVQELEAKRTDLERISKDQEQKLQETEAQLKEERENSLRFADGLRSLNAEMNRLKLDNGHKDYKIKELTEKLKEYQQRDEAIRRREEEGKSLLQKARDDAQNLMAQAQANRDELLRGAKEEQAQLLESAKEEYNAVIRNASEKADEVLQEASVRREELLKEAKGEAAVLEQKAKAFKADVCALRDSIQNLLREMDRCLEESSHTVEGETKQIASDVPSHTAEKEKRPETVAVDAQPKGESSEKDFVPSQNHFFRTAAQFSKK